MTTAHALQPLVSAPVRIGGALAALAVVVVSVAFAGQASHDAIDTAQAALHPAVRYMKLQRVEVVGRRLAGGDVADAACAAPTRI